MIVMKKYRLILCALAVVTILCICNVLVGCGGDEGNGNATGEVTTAPQAPATSDKPEDTGVPASNRYTVVVKDQSNVPVEGVIVGIYEDGQLITTDMTDAEGALIFKVSHGDGEISLRIHGSESVSGYVYPEEPTVLPEGQTRALLQVRSLITYRINLNSIMGEKVAGMLVELCNDSTGEVIDSKISDERGAVSFTVEGGEHYVRIAHSLGNAAFVFSNPDVEGGNTKSLDPKKPDFSAEIVISNADILYSVTATDKSGAPMSGAKLTVYNSELEKVAEAVADGDGVASFNVPNGTYFTVADDGVNYAFAQFELNGATSAQAVSDGSVAVIHGLFAAGSDCSLTVVDAYKKELTFSSKNPLTVEYNGKTYEYGGGNAEPLTVKLTENSGEAAKLKVSGGEFSLSVIRPGSAQDPFILNESELNGLKLKSRLIAGEKVYYSFIPSADATLEADSGGVSVNGRGSRLPVSAGASVTVCFTADTAGEHEFSLTYGQVITDYTVNTQISMENASGVTIMLYDFDGLEYKKIAEGVTVNGVYTFSGLVETDRYFVFAEYPKYGTEDTYVKLESGINPVHLIHVEEGTREHPYSVNYDAEGDIVAMNIALSAGETVWYKLFMPSGYTMSADSKNVSVTVHKDLNMDMLANETEGEQTVLWDEEANAYVHEFETRAPEDGRIMVFIEITAQSDCNVLLTFTPPVEAEETN